MAKKDKLLTPKQSLFVSEYLIDKNASRAYKVAYPNCKNDNVAKTEGSKHLAKPIIRSAVDKGLEEQQKRCEVTADKVIKEISRLAFFDPRKLFDADWRLKPLSELDDDTAAAIGGIDISKLKAVDSEASFQEVVTKLKIWDKNAALEKLAKHFGLFAEDNKQHNTVTINLDCV